MEDRFHPLILKYVGGKRNKRSMYVVGRNSRRYTIDEDTAHKVYLEGNTAMGNQSLQAFKDASSFSRNSLALKRRENMIFLRAAPLSSAPAP
jgi:hypothetical protein